MKSGYKINWPLALATLCALGAIFYIGQKRLKLDSDIISSLPGSDPFVAEAKYIFKNYSTLDNIFVDVRSAADGADPEKTYRAAKYFRDELAAGGLARVVSADKISDEFPKLIFQIVEGLPQMFDQQALDTEVAPLLAPEKIKQTMRENFEMLSSMDGIGQVELISADPLGLRNLVLKRLSAVAVSDDATIYNGLIASNDHSRFLIIAEPTGIYTDGKYSRALYEKIIELAGEANRRLEADGEAVVFSPVGAFRAALDNEKIVRRDANRAALYATIGIAILLIIAFPRPYIGLLALIPALFGMVMAMGVFSLFKESITVLSLGFGGAIISITVDHGIAYLLFLDRSTTTHGRDAAREVWSVGLIATLTTVGAFSALNFSDFPILKEVGTFAAMGVAFSFIFVHTIFPTIFREMPPAKRDGGAPVRKLAATLAFGGGRAAAAAAIVIALGALFYANPKYRVMLEEMNTVSPETLAAEELIRNSWGDILNYVYIMQENPSAEGLRKSSDKLSSFLEKKLADETLAAAFTSSMIIPGADLARQNINDWKSFWSDERTAGVKSALAASAVEIGFSADAFDQFWQKVEAPGFSETELSAGLYEMFGISKSRDGARWQSINKLSRGPNYDGESFYREVSEAGLGRMLDGKLFAERMSRLLADTFFHMIYILGIGVVILLALFFLDIRLTLLGVGPITFAMVCSLAAMNLLDKPVDIPGLLISIVVLGMGVDYTLFFIRSYQRYGDESNPALVTIITAVLLSAGSTLMGLGFLASSEHNLLASAGAVTLLGVGFSVIGAFTILPPFLRAIFIRRDFIPATDPTSFDSIRRAVLARYKNTEAYPRMFIRFKTMLDPMFKDLNDRVGGPKRLLDVGCGFGAPAAWIAATNPEAEVVGVEPDAERVRVANLALGNRGRALVGAAPGVGAEGRFDTITMLDVIHMLNDRQADEALAEFGRLLEEGGRLVLRATIPGPRRYAWERVVEAVRLKILRAPAFFRDEAELRSKIEAAGFRLTVVEPTAEGREETWFIAEKKTGAETGAGDGSSNG